MSRKITGKNTRYDDVFSGAPVPEFPRERVIKEISTLLPTTERSQVESFVAAIKTPIDMHRAHLLARSLVPVARDQERLLAKIVSRCGQLDRHTQKLSEYLNTVDGKLEKLLAKINNTQSDLSELLDETPVSFRRKARETNEAIDVVQRNLSNLMLVANELTARKDRRSLGIDVPIKDIASAYSHHFNVEAIPTSYRENADMPQSGTPAEMFVPVLCTLLNLSADTVSREARKILSTSFRSD